MNLNPTVYKILYLLVIELMDGALKLTKIDSTKTAPVTTFERTASFMVRARVHHFKFFVL